MERAELIEALATARRTGGTAPPAHLSLHQGYRIAQAVSTRLGAVAGWKIGATNPRGQAFLGVDQPIFGRVFEGGIASCTLPPIAGARPVEIEPEMIVELGEGDANAPPIARAWLGLEVNRPSRDDAFDLGVGYIVADNAAHVGLVLGPAVSIEALDDLAAIVATLTHQDGATSHGSAADVLGDPRRAVAWLAQVRARTERPVRAGDLIATGAMARALPLAMGERLTADFGRFGTLSLTRCAEVMPAKGE